MATINYGKMPSPAEFHRDSSVMMAVRSQDRILSHLDEALARYHITRKIYNRRNVILCDMFVTANYWLKSFREKNPAMKEGRYQAILALFQRVTSELQTAFQCTVTQVPGYITEMLGRDLTDGGRNTDAMRNPRYYDELTLRKFRLRFRSGRAYLFEHRSHLPVRLVPLNSELYEQKITVMGTTRLDGWGPFVMTVERDFYMSKHHLADNADPTQCIFHSAYKAAGTVSAAGTMLVKNGQILGLRGDSGHYKPLLHNMAMVVTAFSMLSVPLMPIRIKSFDANATDLGSALDFVRSRLNWTEFENAAKDFRTNRQQRGNAPSSSSASSASSSSSSASSATHDYGLSPATH
jgi:hypothetical protein